MPTHTVQQGEHLSRIAEDYGFDDFRIIWDHAENADLKRERGNPNVLFPGDILFIPERDLKEEDGATEQRHRFKVSRRPLRLRVVLQGLDGQPLRNIDADLHLDHKTRSVTTDGQGRIDEPIPVDAEHARLIFKDPKVPFDQSLEIKIGHLDPVTEQSGQIARLNNLGYNAGVPANASLDGDQELQFRSALEEFQCDQDLEVNGRCDEATRGRLLEKHGC